LLAKKSIVTLAGATARLPMRTSSTKFSPFAPVALTVTAEQDIRRRGAGSGAQLPADRAAGEVAVVDVE
jgi:hypothetical protein